MIPIFSMKRSALNINNAIYIFDGNSLTSGMGGTPYPTQLLTTAPFSSNGSVFYNKGVGAQQTSQMISDAVSDIDVNYSNLVHCFVIANEIGNDIYYNGNVRNAVNSFWNYCDARRLVGFKVGVITLQDRSYSNYGVSTVAGDNELQFRTKIILANTYLRDEYLSHADFLIDIGLNAYIGINATDINSEYNCYNTTYFDDKVHCKTAGYAIWANMVRIGILTYTKNIGLI
jgi:hypothetical protein